MRKLSALLLALFTPTACVVVTEPVPMAADRPAPAAKPAPKARASAAHGKPIVIANDRGGNVMAAVARRQELEASGRPVQIRGYCRSACTIYTTLPNACLSPKATIGFHAPRLPGTEIIPPLVPEIMGSFYRGGILEKWEGGWNGSIKMVKISARKYVQLDPKTRLCK